MIHAQLGNVAPHETLGADQQALFEQFTDEQLADMKFERYGDKIIKPRMDLITEDKTSAVTDISHPYDDPVEMVTNIQKLWVQHSTKNPAWVRSSDPLVAELIARTFPGCEILEWN